MRVEKKTKHLHIEFIVTSHNSVPLKDKYVKLGNKECFDKEQIGVKERFPVTNCQFTS